MKKPLVKAFIWKHSIERGLKAFEKRITKQLPSFEKTTYFDVWDAYIIRGNGYGSYYKVIKFAYNNEIHEIKEHTHDSVLWDNWNQPTAKEKRALFEAVFNNNIERIIDLMILETE